MNIFIYINMKPTLKDAFHIWLSSVQTSNTNSTNNNNYLKYLKCE